MACEILWRYDFKNWDYVKLNTDNNHFTFSWCDDWDGRSEPTVVRQVIVVPGISARELTVSLDNPPIIHGKHLFVKDDYAGFDIRRAKARWDSYQGADWLDKSRMGFLKWWKKNAIPRIGI
jgi:hypothetical protein